jgi:glycosyltransferase involved in cell wall biosynthesis
MSSSPIQLSYVLTTRNKLPYLAEVLAVLIANKKAGEEIIIADGGSTDGTAKYLEQLLKENKIDAYTSETDSGEAHGYNKAIINSRGMLIKVITDDDFFYFPGIERCKEFMLAHPDIDFLATDGFKRRSVQTKPVLITYRKEYARWSRTHRPFSFCGLGIMLRRSSLPLTGLFHAGFMRVDAEIALRVTAGEANIAWYTQPCYTHIENARSNSATQKQQMLDEMEKLEMLYLGKNRTIWQKMRRRIRESLEKRVPSVVRKQRTPLSLDEWKEVFASSHSLFTDERLSLGEFLWKK